jgi:transcriptional regulator
MLRQNLSKLYSEKLVVITRAMLLGDALISRRRFWFDGKSFSSLRGIPLNVVLAMIAVVLGLSAILMAPILPLLVLGVVALFLSFDHRLTTKFVTLGGLSTAMGTLIIVDLPLSPITSLRLDGSSITTTFLATHAPYTLFVIAAIGILCLGIQVELTPVQRDALTALVNIHRHESRAVKGEEIAVLTDRNPGTIRNQMQSLKALNLVESVTGPRGGYKATDAALEALRLDKRGDGDETDVPVIKNGALVKGVSVSEIIFNKVMQPKAQCNGLIRIIGNIRNFNIGDEIEIGPSPVNKVFIRGIVMGRDSAASGLILNVTEIISVPKFPVRKIAKRAIHVSPEASLREASRMLIYNGIREALVEDIPPGLINVEDITRAVAKGRTDLAVRDIMSRSFLTINSEELIFEAMKMLGKTGASQLVVLSNGVLWGIITPRSLIKSLTID